jgi:hypothetical protein
VEPEHLARRRRVRAARELEAAGAHEGELAPAHAEAPEPYRQRAARL